MYLLVAIDKQGYMRAVRQSRTVHRETRGMHRWLGCHGTLLAAKHEWQEHTADKVILALTEDGVGDAVWVSDHQREEIEKRLQIWKGCYGAWPLRRLNGGESG